MRVLRLEITGFGPFHRRQTLDFERAAQDGILLIGGRTGAGKSSVLDAISFALYGAVPRYDGDAKRVRSDHCGPDDETSVVLEFEMSGERYRVRRTPDWERPKRRGAGTTTQKGEAALWRWDANAAGDTDGNAEGGGGEADGREGDGTEGDGAQGDLLGGWTGLAARPTDVAAELAPVLVLNHDQFLQVILLAQNRFQRFLHAKDAERQALLRTLFASQRFDRIEHELSTRRKSAEQAHGTAESLVSGLLDQAEARVERLSEAAGVVSAEVSDADAAAVGTDDASAASLASAQPATGPGARREALAAHADRLRVRAAGHAQHAAAALAAEQTSEETLQSTRILLQRQIKGRAAARDERALQDQTEAIDADRVRVNAAERAARVAEAVRREAAAVDAAQLAAEAEAQASEKLVTARDAAGESPLDFSGADTLVGADTIAGADTLVGADSTSSTDMSPEAAHAAVGRLAALVDRESALTARDSHIDALDAEAEAAHQAMADTALRGEELPGLIEAAEQRERAALTASAPLAEHAAALTRAESARHSAGLAAKLATQLAAAQDQTIAAADLASGALDTYRDLLARRRAGAAGILAAELTPGEPCLVCGSREHPDPAAPEVSHEAVGSSEADFAEADFSEEALSAAELLSDSTREALAATRAAEGALSSELAAAQAEAGSSSVAEADSQVDSARSAHIIALAAAEELPGLRAATQQLHVQRERVAETLRTASAALAAAEAAARSARAERDTELAMLERARGSFDTITARRDAVVALASALDRHAQAEGESVRAAAAAQTTRAEASDALAQQGFADEAAASAAELTAQELSAAAQGIADYDSERQRIAHVFAELGMAHNEQERDTLPLAPIVEHEARWQLAREAARAAAKSDADATHEAEELDDLLVRTDAQLAQSAAGAEALALIRNLAGTVEGKDPNTRRMRLEVFVLAARLEAIIEAANRRLSAMVAGRYTLEHDDGPQARGRQSGLGLRVLDEYTGRARSTESLSGGETFLASLALALGLADVVTAEAGGISLDTIFIDEGFGSLDPDALAQAMAILDGLREGGRTVALISHVAEMKEQIPARIEVVVDASGASRIEYDDTGGPDGAPGKDTPS